MGGSVNKTRWNGTCQNLARCSIPQRIDGFVGLRLYYRRGGVETGSHWDCYYRSTKKEEYPGFLVLDFLKPPTKMRLNDSVL
jgi:hypothetical protein